MGDNMNTANMSQTAYPTGLPFNLRLGSVEFNGRLSSSLLSNSYMRILGRSNSYQILITKEIDSGLRGSPLGSLQLYEIFRYYFAVLYLACI